MVGTTKEVVLSYDLKYRMQVSNNSHTLAVYNDSVIKNTKRKCIHSQKESGYMYVMRMKNKVYNGI